MTWVCTMPRRTARAFCALSHEFSYYGNTPQGAVANGRCTSDEVWNTYVAMTLRGH